MLYLTFLNEFSEESINKFKVGGIKITIVNDISEVNLDRCHIVFSKKKIKHKLLKFISLIVITEEVILDYDNPYFLIESILIKLKKTYTEIFDITNKDDNRMLYNLYNELDMPLYLLRLKQGSFDWRYKVMEKYLVGSSLLDLACGMGSFVYSMIKSERTFDKIIGIDVSDFCVEYVNRNFKNVSAYRFDLMDENLPEYKSDTIICQEILEHLIDPKKIIDYCYRNSKVTIFTTPIGDSSDDPTHIHFWDDHDIKKLFEGKDYMLKKIGRDVKKTNYLIIMEGELK